MGDKQYEPVDFYVMLTYRCKCGCCIDAEIDEAKKMGKLYCYCCGAILELRPVEKVNVNVDYCQSQQKQTDAPKKQNTTAKPPKVEPNKICSEWQDDAISALVALGFPKVNAKKHVGSFVGSLKPQQQYDTFEGFLEDVLRSI